MKFFLPAAADEAQAERVYQALAEQYQAIVTNKRIYQLQWRHSRQDMSCTVDEKLPAYYKTGDEPVIVILDCGNLFKICTPSRGVLRGEPVLAGKTEGNYFVTYFEK
jgi:hypothetical protein